MNLLGVRGELHISISRGMAEAEIVNDEGKRDWDNMNLTAAEQKLISVYGVAIHQNGGLNLHGRVEDDEEWHRIFKMISLYNHLMYKPPWGTV